MRTIALAVVEPSEILTEGLTRIFSRSHFRITYHYSSLAELWEDVPRNDPEPAAILVDAGAHANVTETDIERLQQTYPRAKLVLMTDLEVCQKTMQISEAADGLVLKSSASAVLIKALELILLGERVFPVTAWRQRQNPPEETPTRGVSPSLKGLSEREVEVMELLCEGSPNKVIARRLGISEATVKVHVKAILRKTQAKNRTEAALFMTSLRSRGLEPH